MDNVKVERNAAEEPEAVVLRLTPDEANLVEHMYLVAFGMVCGFLAKLKGRSPKVDTAAIEHGMRAMLADPDTAERVSTLVQTMHRALHHPGQTCQERLVERGEWDGEDEDDPEEPEQNWRCN